MIYSALKMKKKEKSLNFSLVKFLCLMKYSVVIFFIFRILQQQKIHILRNNILSPPPLKKGIQNIDNSLWAIEHYTTLEEKIKIFESRVGMGG